ncbi:dihydrofolate reductase family protein [Chitinophaga pendula]|uniref:dihydrofolate reductase family protein n=1 Tax=Chitinophaga TaxID=79328 RepID=UPI000BB090E1|nr:MULTISPECIES: dihydrofolate reductase family protein [Chitinophaga]ASZ12206.1 riboflavin biosynthesis protein RibD [Chitinophaga sp. MD30]UCJ04764.1 dihydrofolate reductase family protein [Chitinophaga pendula]
MRKLVISEWITLDGIFDAETMAEWFIPYDSEARQTLIREGILACDALLLGRKTYEMLAPYWSQLKNDEMGIANKLNSVAKYVVSSSLENADWQHTTIIRDNITDTIRQLKQEKGTEIQVEGSAELVKTLLDADLVDECVFFVHPVVMGKGQRFFHEGKQPLGFTLADSKVLDKGVIVLTYRRGK